MTADRPLAETIVRHGRSLFGRHVNAADLRILPIAKATRQIVRVDLRGSDESLVVKIRRDAGVGPRTAVATEVSREFDLLSSVWAVLGQAAPDTIAVPQPLLALPEEGLLFMRRCLGVPVDSLLRRWLFGLEPQGRIVEAVGQCGAWLRCYCVLGDQIVWPTLAEGEVAQGTVRRSRHHVYALIGRSGSDLASTMLTGVRRRLDAYRVEASLARSVLAALGRLLSDFPSRDIQVAVHGKFTPADVLVAKNRVEAVDLEQAGRGSQYLDPAYFLYQVLMITRWRPFGLGQRAAERFREVLLSSRFADGDVDRLDLDAFIAYYMVNSLRPGGGLAGRQARACARRWLYGWVARADNRASRARASSPCS